MKIYTRVVLDWDGNVLEEDSFEHDGPVAEAKGAGMLPTALQAAIGQQAAGQAVPAQAAMPSLGAAAPSGPMFESPASPNPLMNPYTQVGEPNAMQPGGQINEAQLFQNAIARMGMPRPMPNYGTMLQQMQPIGPLGEIRQPGANFQMANQPRQARAGGGAQYDSAGRPQFGSFFSLTGAPEDKQWTPYKQGSRAYNSYVRDRRDAENALQGG